MNENIKQKIKNIQSKYLSVSRNLIINSIANINFNKDYLDNLSFKLDPKRLLISLALNESSLGNNTKPRFETAFYYNGKYSTSQIVQSSLFLYDVKAAMSWGAWQIMYIVAVEISESHDPVNLKPEHLHYPITEIYYVKEYIERRILSKHPKKLEDIYDAYNSGSFKDKNIPDKYINNGIYYYHNISNFLFSEEMKKLNFV